MLPITLSISALRSLDSSDESILVLEVMVQTQRLELVCKHRMMAHMGLAEACHALEAPIRHDGHDPCIKPALSIPGGCLAGVLSKTALQPA